MFRPKNLSDEMLYRLDRAVGRALCAVGEEAGIKASVGLTIVAEKDPKDADSEPYLTYKLKCAYADVETTEAGEVLHGQLQLPEFEEDEP